MTSPKPIFVLVDQTRITEGKIIAEDSARFTVLVEFPDGTQRYFPRYFIADSKNELAINMAHLWLDEVDINTITNAESVENTTDDQHS